MATKGRGQLRPEKVASRYYALLNARRFGQAELLVSPRAEFRNQHSSGALRGRAGFRKLTRLWTSAFPDARLETRRLSVADGRIVTADLVLRGTHSGPLLTGVDRALVPSGRPAELMFRQVLDIQDGQIMDAWLLFDPDEIRHRLRGGH